MLNLFKKKTPPQKKEKNIKYIFLHNSCSLYLADNCKVVGSGAVPQVVLVTQSRTFFITSG